MVQILPQPTHLGSQLGQSLGQGFSQGAQRGSEVGFQRSLLQNALKGIENPPPGTTPFQLAASLMQATAGIPGAEKYVGDLFKVLQGQLRGSNTNMFAQGGMAPTDGVQPAQQGQPGQEFQSGGGYLSSPMTTDQSKQLAVNYAMGDPSQIGPGLDIANKLDQRAVNNLDFFRKRASELKVTDDEMPYFIQMAQKSSETNPEKLLVETKRSLDNIRQLDNALVPGTLRGALQKTPPGLLPSMLAGSETREQAVRRLHPAVDQLVKSGNEPIVRQKLAAQQLSPTEIEDLIHPMSKQLETKISSLPKPSKNEDSRINMLADFYKNNIKPDTSLLVMRHKLFSEKGYDWKDQAQAIKKAQDDGLPLTNSQNTELTEFTTRPPRDSLLDIFRDWDQLKGFIRGNK